MPNQDADRHYRAVIDALVRECQSGQGTILPQRARQGTWAGDEGPNQLLSRLGEADRSIIARMLSQAYENAIHDALCVLHDQEVPDFDTAYEGTPFHDFIGRLSGEWAWPDTDRE